MRAPAESGDDLDSLLRGADPSRSFASDTDRLASIAAAAEAALPRTPAKRPPTRAWLALAIAAALGLGAAAPAVAEHIELLSRTGQFGSPGSESDSSEWLNSDGSDFTETIDSIYPDWLPLPASVNADDFERETVDWVSDDAGFTQETGVEVSFEHQARCAWVYEWLAADTNGDEGRAAAAARMLEESARWPATVASDGGGFVDHLLDVATAASTGDRSVVEYHEQSECGVIPSARVE